MDEFEQKSREIAQAILEQHGWKRPMTTEVKEMHEVIDLPYTECKRYLVEEWQNMHVPLLEKENAKLRKLVQDMWFWNYEGHMDSKSQEWQMKHINEVLDRMHELEIEK